MYTDNEDVTVISYITASLVAISIFSIGLFIGYEVSMIKLDKEMDGLMSHYNTRLKECSDVITGHRNESN